MSSIYNYWTVNVYPGIEELRGPFIVFAVLVSRIRVTHME